MATNDRIILVQLPPTSRTILRPSLNKVHYDSNYLAIVASNKHLINCKRTKKSTKKLEIVTPDLGSFKICSRLIVAFSWQEDKDRTKQTSLDK